MQPANIINVITNKYEPQKSTALERSVKITRGLKPVLRDPNLALGFCHDSKHTGVRSLWRFSNSSMDNHGKKNKSPINTMMKQSWGPDRNNVLRPIPGDPLGVEQHHWNTGAKKTNSWIPVGQATDKKKLRPQPTKINSFMSGPSLSLMPDPPACN